MDAEEGAIPPPPVEFIIVNGLGMRLGDEPLRVPLRDGVGGPVIGECQVEAWESHVPTPRKGFHVRAFIRNREVYDALTADSVRGLSVAGPEAG